MPDSPDAFSAKTKVVEGSMTQPAFMARADAVQGDAS